MKPNQNKENALRELKKLTSSGHQIKEVKLKITTLLCSINCKL